MCKVKHSASEEVDRTA